MTHTRSAATCVAWALVLLVAASPAVAGAPGASLPAEEELIAVLKSDSPPQNKAIACKQLAVRGTKAAVPALAALLSDERLASWARIGLEAIPGPEADEALRQAMGKLQGRLLVGVINSIGVRRDARAVQALIAKLKDGDAEVASAAAAALGRIGGDQAAAALEPALATAPQAVRSAVAEGCILCAERLAAAGKSDQAVRLYDAVRKADVPKQRVLEATRGAILARGKAGIPLLIEQLKSGDKALFEMGLTTAREIPGPEATEALAGELARLAPARQMLLVMALADRGDSKALPAVLAVAKAGPKDLRMTAIGALERLGDASCVPVLLDAALEGDAELAQAAKAALAKLPGKTVDPDIAARLTQASAQARPILIELAELRRIEAAVPALVRCTEDADPAVRRAAVAAVGTVGNEKHLPVLLAVLSKTKDAAEQATVEKSLMAICSRGGPACARHLTALAQDADPARRVIALHAASCAGGPDGLAIVKTALNDKDEAVQDEAVRVLSTWPNQWPEDAAAAAPLLALAKSGKKPAHSILGVRGYLQYVRGTKKLGDAERMAAVSELMPLVTRPEEKRLVVSVLGTIATARAMEMLVGFAADPSLGEEACSAIVNLAGAKDAKNIPADQRRKALQVVVEKSKTGRTKRSAEDLMKAIQ